MMLNIEAAKKDGTTFFILGFDNQAAANMFCNDLENTALKYAPGPTAEEAGKLAQLVRSKLTTEFARPGKWNVSATLWPEQVAKLVSIQTGILCAVRNTLSEA